MTHILIAFSIGWLISFLGQLPLGTMSVTATQIAIEESFRNAWKYALGVAIVETIYLRLVLSGVDWITKHQLFYNILGWAAVILFLILGIISFLSAIKQKEGEKPPLLKNKVDRFLLGISMSAINVAQIPFWFIWSTYVIDLGGINKTSNDFNLFTIGCGIGTITGLALYIYGGYNLVTRLKDGKNKLNIIMGIVFIIAALAQAYRMILNNTLK